MRPIIILLLAGLGAVPGGWRHDRDRETFRALGASPEFVAIGRLEVDGNGLPIRLNSVAPHRRWIDSVTARADGP